MKHETKDLKSRIAEHGSDHAVDWGSQNTGMNTANGRANPTWAYSQGFQACLDLLWPLVAASQETRMEWKRDYKFVGATQDAALADLESKLESK